MAFYQRSVFWVIATVVLVVGLFIGSQLWLTYLATPSTGVSASFSMNVAPGGPNATLESWIGTRQTGRWMPQFDLPDAIASTPDPKYVPIEMPEYYALDRWLGEAFPSAQSIEIARTEVFSNKDEGAGFDGKVSQVDLIRADGSYDPFFFLEWETVGAPEKWGAFLRGRFGPWVAFDNWTLTTRPTLWWRNNFRLRREIVFLIHVFVDFREPTEGETYWLDRIPTDQRILPPEAAPRGGRSAAGRSDSSG